MQILVETYVVQAKKRNSRCKRGLVEFVLFMFDNFGSIFYVFFCP
jgi:hypothetical protein